MASEVASLEERGRAAIWDTYLPRKFKIGSLTKETTPPTSTVTISVSSRTSKAARSKASPFWRAAAWDKQRCARKSSQAGRSDWFRSAPSTLGYGEGGSVDPSRFRQPREPSSGALEYVIEAWGVDRFRCELQSRMGEGSRPLGPWRGTAPKTTWAGANKATGDGFMDCA